MKKIGNFLRLEYTEDMLALTDKQSHVILGDRMRSQQEEHKRVRMIAGFTRQNGCSQL